jgi:hypothetical protein
MRVVRRSVLIACLVSLAFPVAALGQDLAGQPDEDTELFDFDPAMFLFVASGISADVDADVLTLDGVESILNFSDRPHRVAFRTGPEEWEAIWDQGADSFAVDPPNAVLVGGTPRPHEMVIELLDVTVAGDRLRFDIEVLDGQLPDGTLRPASLFIDAASSAGWSLREWANRYVDPGTVLEMLHEAAAAGIDVDASVGDIPCDALSGGTLDRLHGVMGDYFDVLIAPVKARCEPVA